MRVFIGRHFPALPAGEGQNDTDRELDEEATQPLFVALKEQLDQKGFAIVGAATSGLPRGNQSAWRLAGYKCPTVTLQCLYGPQDIRFAKSFCDLYERVSGLEFGPDSDVPATYYEQEEHGETSDHGREIAEGIANVLRLGEGYNVVIGHSPDLEIGLCMFGGNDPRLLKPLGTGEGYLFELDDVTFKVVAFEFIALHPIV